MRHNSIHFHKQSQFLKCKFTHELYQSIFSELEKFMLLSARMHKEQRVIFQHKCFAFFYLNSDSIILTLFVHDDLSHQGQR